MDESKIPYGKYDNVDFFYKNSVSEFENYIPYIKKYFNFDETKDTFELKKREKEIVYTAGDGTVLRNIDDLMEILNK